MMIIMMTVILGPSLEQIFGLRPRIHGVVFCLLQWQQNTNRTIWTIKPLSSVNCEILTTLLQGNN